MSAERASLHVPDPGLYKTWQDWAKQMRTLQARQNIVLEQNPRVLATSFPAAALPSAVDAGSLIYIPNHTSYGTVLAFSDGTAYLPIARMSDVPSPAWDFQTFSDTSITADGTWQDVTGGGAFTMPGTPDGSQKYLFTL